MTTHANRELWAAARLVERLAERIGQVRIHVRTELGYADSFPDHTPGASEATGSPTRPLEGNCAVYLPIDADLDVYRPCGHKRPCADHDTPVTLTAVERAAERRLRLSADLADFEAQCKLIVIAASDAMRSADRMIGTRIDGEKLKDCGEAQFGKGGALEWGEPVCHAPIAKGGMCQAHYSKWVRWRTKHGEKTPDIEDAA
jgi:hypothetical protein